MKNAAITLASLMLVLAACATGVDVPADDDGVTDPETTTTSTTTTTTAASPEPADVEDDGGDQTSVPETPGVTTDLSGKVDLAAADLAGRLGMGTADITIFSAETVTWRDGALGCPEEGRAYTQALVTDGYRIVLSANGELHSYHGRGTGDPFYCADPQEPYESGNADV